MSKNTSLILKTGEVARLLGVSIPTVRKMIDRGDLPGFRLPGSKHRRIKLADVLRVMEELENEHASTNLPY